MVLIELSAAHVLLIAKLRELGSPGCLQQVSTRREDSVCEHYGGNPCRWTAESATSPVVNGFRMRYTCDTQYRNSKSQKRAGNSFLINQQDLIAVDYAATPSFIVSDALSDDLELHQIPVADTFAEAFNTVGTRIVVTAATGHWAEVAASEMCGYATSVIACDVEAAIEGPVSAETSPDGRPGVSVLAFAFSRDALAAAMTNRVGQCVLTCPTTACYNGVADSPKDKQISIGGQLRFFGDGFQIAKKLGNRRLWRIPVMDGEFVCEDRFGTVKGIAGGNLLICAVDQAAALAAAEAAVTAMQAVPETILPVSGRHCAQRQ